MTGQNAPGDFDQLVVVEQLSPWPATLIAVPVLYSPSNVAVLLETARILATTRVHPRHSVPRHDWNFRRMVDCAS
jgi:hypothetical protein